MNAKKINLKGIVIIVGNYGSGKTEVTLNLAAYAKKNGVDVSVADLDLVNPYFRTREAVKFLSNLGINSILPEDKYLKADLPILTPKVAGILRNPSELTILDAGGDDAGATVLGALTDHLSGKKITMLQVVNNYRPFTGDIKGCLKIGKQIEKTSRLKITGIIGNSNLMDQTEIKDIYKGYEFAKSLADESGLTLEFITSPAKFLPKLEKRNFLCPILPIKRELNFPWQR
ncbi:MAG: cobalamin biosynthesis protein CbiA [Deltaproteobacteria bacterium]|nr:cobalamin biosynthesis protein CbiA [Deltaproteobacteria bacterium]